MPPASEAPRLAALHNARPTAGADKEFVRVVLVGAVLGNQMAKSARLFVEMGVTHQCFCALDIDGYTRAWAVSNAFVRPSLRL
jgi:malic enzyme